MDIDTIPVPRQTNSTNTSTLQYVATRTISSRVRKDWAETRRERASFPHLSLSFGRSAGSAGQRLRPAERPCVHASLCMHANPLFFKLPLPNGSFPFRHTRSRWAKTQSGFSSREQTVPEFLLYCTVYCMLYRFTYITYDAHCPYMLQTCAVSPLSRPSNPSSVVIVIHLI